MAEDNSKIISVLNNLIETCKDGENGFRTAAECVKNNELKTLFQSYSQQRERFATELQNEVRRLGGDPEERGSMAAVLHRGWTNIKALVTGGNENAVVTECERGEDMAKKNYQEALKETLPTDLRAIVQRQFAGIKEAHDRIRALEVVTEKLT